MKTFSPLCTLLILGLAVVVVPAVAEIKTLLNGGPDGNTCLLGSSIPPQAPVPFNGVVCTFNTREKKYDCPVGNEAFNIACEKAGGSFEVGSGH